ncbi:polycomb protein SCMH1 isoform X3 [Scyliorhinus torazame]|uniref:polycomb protein SCMH1 isoform X3 n=1 Tax=Scyliorhinus torazame TaxID=75743 RepID=UPI003B5ACD07
MQSAMKVASEHTPGRRGRKPGRKRRQELLQSAFKLAVQNAVAAPSKIVLPLKIPKKRGPKPGSKRKPRIPQSPPPISPTLSTPEPDTSTVPQDAATVPSSAISQALTGIYRCCFLCLSQQMYCTVCIYVNKHACAGPHLDKKKLQQLPDHFGPARASMVLQQAVQACIDCAYQQKAVFSCLKQGHGGELISETVMPEDDLIGAVENRYGADLLDSPIHSMNPTSPSRRNSGEYRSTGTISYNYRSSYQSSNGPPSSGLRRLSSSPGGGGGSYDVKGSSNTASSPASGPERHVLSQDFLRSPSRHPSTWTVEDVMRFVRESDPQALGPHAELFKKHEIDGNALILLKSDMIMKYMGLKLGPALKLCYHIDKLKHSKY